MGKVDKSWKYQINIDQLLANIDTLLLKRALCKKGMSQKVKKRGGEWGLGLPTYIYIYTLNNVIYIKSISFTLIIICEHILFV